MLEQEIIRVKKVLEDTQSQLDSLKAEKQNLSKEVTQSVAKIATLEDELADEKLKREHSAFDLQEQLKVERKLREISEERLANLRTRYESQFPNVGIGAEIERNPASGDMKNRAEHQLLLEVI